MKTPGGVAGGWRHQWLAMYQLVGGVWRGLIGVTQ
jgi:hypothetical protein